MTKNSGNTNSFTINYTMPDGEVVNGKFTTKRLAIRDRSALGVRKSQLSGGMYCVRDDEGNPTGQGLDEDTDYLNTMSAHLEVALIQFPEWWNLSEVADLGLVREVYNKVLAHETTFLRTPNGKDNTQGQGQVGDGGGDPQPAQADIGNIPTQVVDQEVSAALDA